MKMRALLKFLGHILRKDQQENLKLTGHIEVEESSASISQFKRDCVNEWQNKGKKGIK